MPNFSSRSLLPEKMDQQNLPVPTTQQALAEIEFINKWLGGYHVILNALASLQWTNQTITIMDFGSGGGDNLRVIADWATKNNKSVRLIGVDINPVMTTYAASRSTAFDNIEFITMSVFDNRLLDIKSDITMNSLFCHHFDNSELVKLIQVMHQQATQNVIINDLHRHWLAYYSIKLLTALFSKNYLVKYDAPLSVARSLTRKEWKEILHQAGIHHYSLRWMWAWRWQIIINKNSQHAD